MIPGWKVRREMTRLGQQLRAIPEALWEPVVQRRHDAAFARGFPVESGQVPQSAKIAILLIWQPRGLCLSVLDLCHHLVGQGYAPFVISNAPLPPQDRARLLPCVWRVMERPNVGYDFGGYRDGIRQLQVWDIAPERLVILNDSIWFPLSSACTMLQRMEASGADIVGTVLRQRGDERFLESYAFSLPRRTWAHPAFVAFWRDLRLTSNKYKVIRRGERGFGRAMRAAGLRLEGMFGQDDFLRLLAGADDALLHATLQHTASQIDAVRRDGLALAQGEGAAWRNDALVFVERALQTGLFYSTFPVAAVRLMAYPVLKKSKEPISALWRQEYIRAVQAGHLPMPPQHLWDEACATVPRDTRPAADSGG